MKWCAEDALSKEAQSPEKRPESEDKAVLSEKVQLAEKQPESEDKTVLSEKAQSPEKQPKSKAVEEPKTDVQTNILTETLFKKQEIEHDSAIVCLNSPSNRTANKTYRTFETIKANEQPAKEVPATSEDFQRFSERKKVGMKQATQVPNSVKEKITIFERV
ncbi:MAG: hypothetical protein IC227_03215 [Enterococcus lacertideformus]|uniref:Uncharacterized protein n=1 Tax=Enterococcus lacertideformus TaxID=2771493 RepID=A0A931AYA8_9ENTE|nr:hypothetical protein [Enterococcus lacertideformus]